MANTIPGEAVTRRMKLAEIRAAMWLDRCIDIVDGTGDDVEARVKFEQIKRRVESLAPWRYGPSDPEQLFSALDGPLGADERATRFQGTNQGRLGLLHEPAGSYGLFPRLAM
jgi:hypothetical protein